MKVIWKKLNYKSDKETVSIYWDDKSINYHYNFIEKSIAESISKCETMLDIGAGYGHWVKFYQNSYKAKVEAIEPGLNEYNIKKYRGFIQDITTGKKYDVINAIGVLHHIKKDKDLVKALSNIESMMHSESMLVIGTRFDFLTVPKELNRKYRTHPQWKELLKNFDIIKVKRSNPPFECRKHLDVIICKKKG